METKRKLLKVSAITSHFSWFFSLWLCGAERSGVHTSSTPINQMPLSLSLSTIPRAEYLVEPSKSSARPRLAPCAGFDTLSNFDALL